jgi:hypothetical protein
MPIGKTFTISIQIPNNRVKSDNHEGLVHDVSMATHANKKQIVQEKGRCWLMTNPKGRIVHCKARGIFVV